jgi:hypothetical protein
MDTTCLANGQRQVATLNYEISTFGKRSQGRPLEILLDRFTRPEQVTKRKNPARYMLAMVMVVMMMIMMMMTTKMMMRRRRRRTTTTTTTTTRNGS